MKTITLANVLPQVFAGEAQQHKSDVWLTSLTFERGRCYCVNAPSGTGKTSLCAFVTGRRTDYLGRISFDSRDISTLGIDDWCSLRRTSLAYLPQELDLFDELSAMDNVLLKNRLTDCRSEREIRDMFAALEIDHRTDALAGRLSVGQKQRVALIRALCQPFDFALLDEPVSHLDERNNRLCSSLIMAHASQCGAGVIFTSVGNPLLPDTDVININL